MKRYSWLDTRCDAVLRLFQNGHCMKFWGSRRFKWAVSTLNMPQQSDEHLSSVFDELNKLSFQRQQLMDRRNVLAMLIQFKRNNGQNEQR